MALIINLILFAAWVTHVIYTISAQLYVLLLVGMFIFPVGIIHGVMIWFGYR